MSARLDPRRLAPDTPLRRVLTALLFTLWALGMCVAGVALGLRPVTSTLWTAWQARGWTPVEATVIEHEPQDPESSRPTPQATYRYTLDGRGFVADRIGVAPPAYDGFDRWQADWDDRLMRARRDGFTLTAWVDPRAPHRAVLDRQLRWKPLLWRGVMALMMLSLSWWLSRAVAPAWQGADWTRQRGVWGFMTVWSGASVPVAGFWFLQEPEWGGLVFAAMFWGGAWLFVLGARAGKVESG